MLKLQGDWQTVDNGVRRRIVLDGEALMLVEVHFQPGAVGTLHSHPHEQATRILSGRVSFTLNGYEIELYTGDYLHIPANAQHGLVALEESFLLDVFSPPRADFRL
jgi:quercetin dioxygenase-like cupin family protein